MAPGKTRSIVCSARNFFQFTVPGPAWWQVIMLSFYNDVILVLYVLSFPWLWTQVLQLHFFCQMFIEIRFLASEKRASNQNYGATCVMFDFWSADHLLYPCTAHPFWNQNEFAMEILLLLFGYLNISLCGVYDVCFLSSIYTHKWEEALGNNRKGIPICFETSSVMAHANKPQKPKHIVDILAPSFLSFFWIDQDSITKYY